MLTLPGIMIMLIPMIYLYNIPFSLIIASVILYCNYMFDSPIVKFLSQSFILFSCFSILFLFCIFLLHHISIYFLMFLVYCGIGLFLFDYYAPITSSLFWDKVNNSFIFLTPIKLKITNFLNLLPDISSEFDNELSDKLYNLIVKKLKYKDCNSIDTYMETKKEGLNLKFDVADDLELPIAMNTVNVSESKLSINNKNKLKDKIKEKKNQRLGKSPQTPNPNTSMPMNINVPEMLKIPGIKNMVSDYISNINNEDFEKMIKESLKDTLKSK